MNATHALAIVADRAFRGTPERPGRIEAVEALAFLALQLGDQRSAMEFANTLSAMRGSDEAQRTLEEYVSEYAKPLSFKPHDTSRI